MKAQHKSRNLALKITLITLFSAFWITLVALHGTGSLSAEAQRAAFWESHEQEAAMSDTQQQKEDTPLVIVFNDPSQAEAAN